MQWDADDVERYDIEEEKIGQFVFTDDTRPFRLYDLSHELKNLPSRIHDRGESYHMSNISYDIIYIITISVYHWILVKSSGANGDKMGIGNRNRLNMTLFIQQSIQAFHEMPEVHQSKTPLDWVNRVHQILNHFRGDHTGCDILERFGLVKLSL